MSGLRLFVVGAGLLFTLHLSAAARSPDSGLNGQRLVRHIAAPDLVVLGILIFPEITRQYRP